MQDGFPPTSEESYRKAGEAAAKRLIESSLNVLGDVKLPEGGFASPSKTSPVKLERLKSEARRFHGQAKLDTGKGEEEDDEEGGGKKAGGDELTGPALNPMCLEMYLSDSDFVENFEMPKEEFYFLKQWQQRALKKKAGIF